MDKTRKLNEFYTQSQALECLGLPLTHNTVLYRAVKKGILDEGCKIGTVTLYPRQQIHDMAGRCIVPDTVPATDLALRDVVTLAEAMELTGMSHEWLYRLSNKRGDNPNPSVDYRTFCKRGRGGYFVRSSLERYIEQRDRTK